MARGRGLHGGLIVAAALLVAACGASAAAASSMSPAPSRSHGGTLLPKGKPSPYGASKKGEFVTTCTLANRAAVDPIVARGKAPFGHEHDFFGNTSTDANSVADSLLGQDTTCTPPLDAAAYWVATLLHDGHPVTPTSVNFFYRVNAPQDPAKVKPLPTGLKMIAGNSSSASKQPGSVVRWSCASGARTAATIPDCHGADLVLTVRFPECWDGVHLDSANHQRHMAYARGKSCPADHPVLVPQLVFQLQWPVPAGGTNRLSSDPTMNGTAASPGLTAHGDFINAWNPTAFKQRVNVCLHAAVVCDKNGTVTGS